jgi:cold shock protein
MTMQGTVARVLTDRGFGFIASKDHPKDLFFHIKDTDGRLAFDSSLINRRVEFDLESTPKGMAAVNVKPIET